MSTTDGNGDNRTTVNARDKQTHGPWMMDVGYHQAQVGIYANHGEEAEHLGAVTFAVHAGAACVQTYLSVDEADRIADVLIGAASAARDADRARREVAS